MIKSYNQFISEESNLKSFVAGLASFLSLGLSEADAQQLKNNPVAVSVVDSCNKYNKYVKNTGVSNTKMLINSLDTKIVEPNLFMKNFIKVLPDKTITLTPDFIKGLKLNLNPETKEIGFNYTYKF